MAKEEDEARRAPAERRHQAWQLARRLARMLQERYGTWKIVLIESLVLGDFTPWSDVDLVAFGIPPERFLRAYGDAMDAGLDAGIGVDLLEGDTLPESFGMEGNPTFGRADCICS